MYPERAGGQPILRGPLSHPSGVLFEWRDSGIVHSFIHSFKRHLKLYYVPGPAPGPEDRAVKIEPLFPLFLLAGSPPDNGRRQPQQNIEIQWVIIIRRWENQWRRINQGENGESGDHGVGGEASLNR